jgi:hypothetical protein
VVIDESGPRSRSRFRSRFRDGACGRTARIYFQVHHPLRL